MARPTRSQRRARRQEQQRSGSATANGGFAQRGRVRQVQQPARQAPARPGRRIPFITPLLGFSGESVGELKKVEWPNRPQVIQATIVVVLACVIVGGYLFAFDALWKYIVHHFLLP
ncbi:MAG: preprotein translocase subunit SecE [Gaiellaceae bacterium]